MYAYTIGLCTFIIITMTWQAALIDASTQCGKTFKCFQVLYEKLKNTENSVVIFITQANNTTSVMQLLQRVRMDENMSKLFHHPKNIMRSAGLADLTEMNLQENLFIVDFWHSKNMSQIEKFVRENSKQIREIIIVIDESEQGNEKGVYERLLFINKIERIKHRDVKVIFITATVANLSKCIMKVSKLEETQKDKKGIVNDILNNDIVEHYYVTPSNNFVSPSWFKESNAWHKLVFPRKKKDDTPSDYNRIKEDVMIEKLKTISDDAKELCLIISSIRTDDHSRMADKLYKIGFNVTIELNGVNNKNFLVKYTTTDNNNIASWNIPYKEIDKLADSGELDTFYNSDKKVVKSNIRQKEDITLSHMLQASLFMGTDAEKRIKSHITQIAYDTLDAINHAILNLSKSLRRPLNFPSKPRVAIIAGQMAGRGNSIQNPFIDFICTSFCFTDNKDSNSRGASNAQRFGRACGKNLDIYKRDGWFPCLIATETIVRDAIANEKVLCEKVQNIPNGKKVSLKYFISKSDWEKTLKTVKVDLMSNNKIANNTTSKSTIPDIIEGISVEDLNRKWKSKNKTITGRMLHFIYLQEKPITFEEFKDGIEYDKTDKKFLSLLDGGRGLKCRNGKLWISKDKNQHIEINPVIKNYLQTIII